MALHNSKELCIQSIKSVQVTKPAGKIWYDLLKYIFLAVEIIRSCSDHVVFTWTYKTYKFIFIVETYDILMITKRRIYFEILNRKFNTLFHFKLQEGDRNKILNITIIHSKHVMIID